jgi:hypothetical protein
VKRETPSILHGIDRTGAILKSTLGCERAYELSADSVTPNGIEGPTRFRTARKPDYVWIAVTYVTAIVFEIVNLWQASERPAKDVFLSLK